MPFLLFCQHACIPSVLKRIVYLNFNKLKEILTTEMVLEKGSRLYGIILAEQVSILSLF